MKPGTTVRSPDRAISPHRMIKGVAWLMTAFVGAAASLTTSLGLLALLLYMLATARPWAPGWAATGPCSGPAIWLLGAD
jgi:hypothetical protein